MQKPSSIDLTAGIMAIFIVLGIVATFTMAIPAMPDNPMVSPSMVATATHIIGICVSVIAAVCVFFYWKGHEWARWVVMIDAVLVLLGLYNVGKTWPMSHLAGGIKIGQAILAVYLLWYLNTAPVKAWFKMPKSGASDV